MASVSGSEGSAKTVRFRKLFTYATKLDYALIVIGGLGAVGMGVVQPLLFYFVGNIYSNIDPDNLKQEFYDNAVQVAYLQVILGTVYIALAYIAVVSFVTVGSRQANHFRRHYMQSVLRQDAEWFDGRAVAELPNALTTDTIKIERATGDKLVMVVFTFVMVVSALAISLSQALQLTLVAAGFAPFMIGGLYLANKTMERNARMDDNSYKEAGGIAEEALAEIKTVAAHNAQSLESRKYSSSLQQSYKEMLKNGLKVGVGMGLFITSFRSMTACVVVAAATLIREERDNWISGDRIDVGSALITVFVCIVAFSNVGTLAPCLKIIIEGSIAGASVLNIINTNNKIVSGGHRAELQGVVEFKDVEFAYPSAPQKPVLKKVSLSFRPGDTLAILGETGSGKSTVVGLLMRFYDRTAGEITIDGVDIRDWDLAALRSQIGLVSQEPILFNGTIKENIRFGLPSATDAEIEEAAKKSEVVDFIHQLPERFDTKVGSKGSQLSGGERQRIAIARAIIRSPRMLLLDESTSALDKNTEAAVQVTLNTLMSSCTTVMIAHRISTIRKATKVVVMCQGEVAECGTQQELIEKQGKFYHTMMMQNMKMDEENDEPLSAATSTTVRKRVQTTDAHEDVSSKDSPKENYGKRISSMIGGSRAWLLVGIIGSIVAGIGHPFEGMLFGLELETLGSSTEDDLERESRFYGGLIGAVAVGMFAGMVLQAVSFPLISAKATKVMRQESFKALLSYDLAFFDQNNPTVLATQLSSDCEKVNGLGGNIFGLLFGVVCSLVASFTIAGIYCWQIMLIVFIVFPVYVLGLVLSVIAQAHGLVSYKFEDATVYASDCILNYKTVKAFGMEANLLEKYMHVVESASLASRKKARLAGFFFGLGYGLLFYVYALMFWFAAKMFYEDIVEFDAMNVAVFAGISGTSSIFMSSIFAPDLKQGQIAAKNLFKILDYEPTIDPNSENGDKTPITGEITFNNVSFKYPSRDLYSLNDVSFTIPAGSTFAIVGTTGSGKSTVIQLLLRFYDATDGTVMYDNRKITDLNVRSLRSQIAIVSQEPVLFSGSIASNIAYGVEATSNEVKLAAEQAQALNFIEAHPDGFNREVGLRGTHLSGGEKQRVAIARAIIRKPKLLILDEATSALDSDTEAKLIDILKAVMVGRTCVVVAHRIKTISTLDQIAVLSNGSLLEIGSFDALMEKKGFLYSLAKQR